MWSSQYGSTLCRRAGVPVGHRFTGTIRNPHYAATGLRRRWRFVGFPRFPGAARTAPVVHDPSQMVGLRHHNQPVGRAMGRTAVRRNARSAKESHFRPDHNERSASCNQDKRAVAIHACFSTVSFSRQSWVTGDSALCFIRRVAPDLCPGAGRFLSHGKVETQHSCLAECRCDFVEMGRSHGNQFHHLTCKRAERNPRFA